MTEKTRNNKKSAVLVMENTDDIVEMCLFCFKNLDNAELLKLQCVNSQDVYDSCCRLISKDDLGVYFFKWNNCTPLPFCNNCFLSAKKLSLMNSKLEALQEEFDKLVKHFTEDFLKKREENICCDVKRESAYSDIDLPDTDSYVSYEDQLTENIGATDGEDTILYQENCTESEGVTVKTENVDSDVSDKSDEEGRFNVNASLYIDDALVHRESVLKRSKNTHSKNSEIKVKSKSLNKLEYVRRKHILPRRKAALKAAELFRSVNDDLEEIEDDAQFNISEDSPFEPHNNSKSRKVGKKRGRPSKRDLKTKPCNEIKMKTKCKYCKIICTITELESHVRMHNEERPFVCPKCGFRFRTQSFLIRHLKKHFNEKVFKCAHCENTYKYMHCLKDHIRIQKHHEDTKDSDGECKLCEKAIVQGKEMQRQRKVDAKFLDSNLTETAIKNVQQENSSNDPDSFICESSLIKDETELESGVKCAIKRNRKRGRAKKVDEIYKNGRLKKLYKCADCNKNCYSKRKLLYHQHSHQPPGTEINCGECNEVFIEVATLQNHRLSSHAKPPKAPEESKIMQCTICFKILSSKGNLNKHMYLHNEVKQFPCPTCTKRFSTKSALTAHSVYHKKDRPYLCEECGQGFHTGTKLREHYRVHTGMLLYCEYCPKGFRNSTHLKQHLRVHNKGLQQQPVTKHLENEAITLQSRSTS